MTPIHPSQASTAPADWEERARILTARVRNPHGEPDLEALFELADLLPAEDGKPMESSWHRAAISLLIEVLTYCWRDRRDFYVGGNMFVYYFDRKKDLPQSKGPDFFVALGVEPEPPRDKWVVFTEGKFPQVIVELLSPSTAREDRTRKKDVYESVFETDEYFLYDPETRSFDGYRLDPRGRYQPLEPDRHGRLRSGRLDLWLGTWEGVYTNLKGVWPRFYDDEGKLVPLMSEAEAERAQAEKQRAEAAEAELEKLRTRIAELERGQQNG